MTAANTSDSLNDLSAGAAIAAMRSGDLRAEDYARALLDRAHRLLQLNAFRTLNREAVLETARAADRLRLAGKALGMLHGLPIPVKDSVNTLGLPTSQGTRALHDFWSGADAAVLKPLFAQGALLMGKTNLHEISRGWTSNNEAFGPVLNPYDLQRVPGGSSGGSAAAVAARIAPLAVAEDTLGSIRVPASMCGLAGLRPTFGRYPGSGIMPLTVNKFDQVGPLARCVDDLALFDAVVTGEGAISRGTLRGARVGISPEYFLSDLDPEVERITLEVIRKLQDAGATVVTAEIPDVMRQATGNAAVIIAHENVAAITAYLEEHATGLSFGRLLAQLSPNIQAVYRDVPPLTREHYQAALELRARVQAATREYYAANALDVLVFPSIMAPPPPLGDNLEIPIRGIPVPIRKVMSRNTALGSVASLCSLVLPGGLTADDLPVGIEFAALPGQDRALLSLGMAIETTLGSIPPPRC